MADTASAFMQVPRPRGLLLLIGLLVCSTSTSTLTLAERDGTDRQCPDYVTSHAPLLWLHSDDRYMPSDLLAHIHHTSPALDGKPLPDLPPLDLDNLEILNDFGDAVALTSNDDPTTYPPWLLGTPPDSDGTVRDATPCVVILVDKNERDVDAFYFYFYSYNEGPNITQVLEPFNHVVKGEKAASGMHFGDHIGDWEHNMIRFRDGKPVGIYFSQHVDGSSYSWDDSELSKTDGRCTWISCKLSNTGSPSDQIHNAVLVDYCDQGRRWDPVLSAYFYRFDPKSFTLTQLDPPDKLSRVAPPQSSNLTSFFYYSGRWGDVSYPDSDPRQEKVPWFKLRRFQSGPTGPRHKHLVRKGLKPDHVRKLGWMEWGVGIYMSLYPCCLKGWRAWVSIGLVVAVLSGAVIAAVIGLRRYRTRNKYRRLEEEDILLDDWVLEDDALLTSSDDEDGKDDQGVKHSR
ncbi:hypothetical protein LX36DRAFT_668474 [Colletotrichum falcatum]|nr:hypothetical protein LX36DRAFT_668474 [Colletotrichum falcatum]